MASTQSPLKELGHYLQTATPRRETMPSSGKQLHARQDIIASINVRRGAQTEPVVADDSGTIISPVVERTPNSFEQPQRQASADGAVISVGGVSVSCELYAQAGVVPIRLPRTLFPDSVAVGMPFTLAMVEASGVRRPVITPRRFEPSCVSEGNAQMAAIVESL